VPADATGLLFCQFSDASRALIEDIIDALAPRRQSKPCCQPGCVLGISMAVSGIAAPLVNRVGARPVLLVGGVISTSGPFWLSRSGYTAGTGRPLMVTGVRIGIVFVPMSLVLVTKICAHDTG
jgi:hypothetical protein